ncbi:glutathione ABC transporter substrate-binding protein [Guptibacillus hwajinpoensis]|uniref:Peptide/nickel transport system substrate-binding protein n=1 Tax=Guptibacillus hwajinpoensis TaxID=208199 RepID=A0ABU0JZL6_9BACL|nr:glutathione ABC transporter substrate-binding protein [Alkalihalobacillus hemicentroti]MDQ0482553.1 peptide/nickel transport system substrate-binding protein [Alkalihalobacillus hemicentroti]
MNKLWNKSVALVLFIFVLALAGCSGESSSGSDGGKDVSQELTYAATSDIVGLSPIDTNDSVSSAMIEQVYETLFVRDPKTMEIKPQLAESYENPDDTTWKIKLKEDVTFHDGTPFNAEAVKYTFEQFLDEERAAPRASLLEPIESVEVEGEYTVVINTKEPYGPLLAALSHTNASIVSPEADQSGDLNEQPVGTGPFTFVEWVQGDKVTLEANEDYWQGAPDLKKVTMKVVPEYSTAVSMLQTGEVQFLDNISSEHLPRIESMENVEIDTKEGTPVYYLGFNMNKEPFNDPKFREAIAHAIDREAYVNQLGGLGIQNDSIIGPKVFGYKEEAKDAGYDFDTDIAKQMLEDNGYANQKITLLAANTGNYMKMAEIVQAQLSDVGLDVSIESMEWGTFLDTTTQGKFEMTFLGWSNSTADGSELLYPNLHSDNLGSSNRTGYDNSEFDALVDASRVSVDQVEREKKLHEANMMALEDAVWIPMHHGVVTAAYDQSVKGLELDPTGQWSLYNVHRE